MTSLEPNLDRLADVLRQAEDTIQSKEERGEIGRWSDVFRQLDGFDPDDMRNFNLSLQAILLRNSRDIVKNESRKSRRGGMLRPTIMSAETGCYIFDKFTWNNLDNPENFSDDMKSLRTLLNAHSDETHNAEVLETKEKQDEYIKKNRRIDPIALTILAGLAAAAYKVVKMVLENIS